MTEETLVPLVWLIPALPLASFFLIFLFARGRNRLSHTIAIGSVLIAFVLAQIVFWSVIGSGEDLAKNPIASSFAWLPTSGTPLTMGIHVDPLTAIMLFMVPIAVLMI